METPLSPDSRQNLSVEEDKTHLIIIPETSTHTYEEHKETKYENTPTVAQFSLGPITHTTVVTTTTITTTNFPPIVFYPPKKKKNFDSKQYPLYDAPTPACLKRFCFDIDGKPAYFRESDTPQESLSQMREDMERLQKNNTVTIVVRGGDEQRFEKKDTRIVENEIGLPMLQPESVLGETSYQGIHNNSLVSYEDETFKTRVTHKNTSKHVEHESFCSNIEEKGFQNIVDVDPLDISNASLNKNISNEGSQNQLPIESNPPSYQLLPLPSPSLSPVITTLNSENEHYYTARNSRLNTTKAVHCKNQKENHEQVDIKEINTFVLSDQGNSIIRIPEILNIFDNLPPNIQTYLIHHLLRRCNKTTLQIVANLVNPTLKRDFLALLPFELAFNILKELDVKSLCRATQVSKKWKQIVDADEWIWKMRFDVDGFKLRDNELDQIASEGWVPQCENSNDTSSTHTLKETKHVMHINSNIYSKKSEKALNIQNQKHSLAEHRETTEKYFQKVENKESDLIQKQHLFKALYKKHHIIRKNWMSLNIKPRHISFRCHDRNVVTCLQFDADKIITGSDDSSINIYDTSTGKLRRRLQGHEGGVWALQYLGNSLVSGSTDRTVRVWDIAKGECTQIFEGHISTVRCLQILPSTNIEFVHNGTKKQINTSVIVTGSRDSTLRVWRLPQPGEAHYRPSPPSSPNAVNTDSTNVSTNPYYIRTLVGHTNSVRAISGYNNILVSGSYDSTVRVWRISTGECIWRLVGHSQKVYSVVIDSKRNRCVSGSMDWKVKIWSLETGTCLWTLEGHSSLVGLLDLSYDYLVSAAADSTLRIWDPDTGKCIHVLSSHTGAITCFQHDENKVISGSDGLLKMWDVRTGRFVANILTDLSGVWQVRFDERRCVAAVQRDHITYIEVLDFGAAADGVPEEERGRRIIVDNSSLMDDLAQTNREAI
ncbi:hypothetical protein T552_03220 [Pneumocystis carinii B80]|uniref:F-box domain-containing protein n=1 Tax=Pneumocystis carinii (strain B80) TaxID=1408658 RepID=A0A0W4ZC63_PNEC8|nr:hypothetical protein T552_03220 [Pneumocystis carinii B80]KTW25946.1 hypothetical protein T552_03220 [Pneumocystis carinii B80]